MTDATFFDHMPKADTAQVTLPAPVPFAPPTLIGDCATPLCGTTVLGLLWRRLDARHDTDPTGHHSK